MLTKPLKIVIFLIYKFYYICYPFGPIARRGLIFVLGTKDPSDSPTNFGRTGHYRHNHILSRTAWLGKENCTAGPQDLRQNHSCRYETRKTQETRFGWAWRGLIPDGRYRWTLTPQSCSCGTL